MIARTNENCMNGGGRNDCIYIFDCLSSFVKRWVVVKRKEGGKGIGSRMGKRKRKRKMTTKEKRKQTRKRKWKMKWKRERKRRGI